MNRVASAADSLLSLLRGPPVTDVFHEVSNELRESSDLLQPPQLKSCLRRSPKQTRAKSLRWDTPSNAVTYVPRYDEDHLEDFFYTEEDFAFFEADANRPKPKKKPTWATGGKRRRSSGGGKKTPPRPSPATSQEMPIAAVSTDVYSVGNVGFAFGDDDSDAAAEDDGAAENVPLQEERSAKRSCLPSPWSGGAQLAGLPPALPPPSLPPDALTQSTAASTAVSHYCPPVRAPPSAAVASAASALPPPRTRREARLLTEIQTLGVDELKQKIREVASSRRQHLAQTTA